MRHDACAPAAEIKIRIAIVDDHPLILSGLKQIIEADERFRLVIESPDGALALEQIKSHAPDLAVVGVNSPGTAGLELVEALQSHRVKCRILILTIYKDETTFNRAMNLGVNGYLLTESAVSDIAAGLRAVARGDYYISPAVSGFVARRHARAVELKAGKPALNGLTAAERRILKLIADNRTSKEIAAELFVSLRTVETHRANICRKLDLEGSQPLLRFALEHHDLLQL